MSAQKFQTNRPEPFVTNVFTHFKDFWADLSEWASIRGPAAVFLEGHDLATCQAIASLLDKKLTERDHTSVVILPPEPGRFPGFQTFSGIIDRFQGKDSFAENCIPKWKLPLETLQTVSHSDFDSELSRTWWDFNILRWSQHCAQTTDNTVSALMSCSDSEGRTHFIFIAPNLSDSHVFNCLLLFFRRTLAEDSFSSPIPWLLIDKSDKRNSEAADLLFSLMKVRSSVVRKAGICVPNPLAFRSFLEANLGLLHKNKAEKITVDVLINVKNNSSEPLENKPLFEPSVWMTALKNVVPFLFNEDETTQNECPNTITRDEWEEDIRDLIHTSRFQQIQKQLLQKGDFDALCPLEAYTLAMSHWLAPSKEFHNWLEPLLKKLNTTAPQQTSFSLFALAALQKMCINSHEPTQLQTLTDYVRARSVNLPNLSVQLSLIDLLLARMLGDPHAATRAVQDLSAVDSKANHCYHEILIATAKTIELCFHEPAEFQNTDTEYLRAFAGKWSVKLEDVAHTTPWLFSLFAHSLITAKNTFGAQFFSADEIDLLTQEIEIRYKIFPALEQCLATGNLATGLAEKGHYSAACARTEESLALAKGSSNPAYIAYALHDTVACRLRGGVHHSNWQTILDTSQHLLSTSGVTLEIWRTKSLEIFCAFWAGESAECIKERILKLDDFVKAHDLDIPCELEKENPHYLIFLMCELDLFLRTQVFAETESHKIDMMLLSSTDIISEKAAKLGPVEKLYCELIESMLSGNGLADAKARQLDSALVSAHSAPMSWFALSAMLIPGQLLSENLRVLLAKTSVIGFLKKLFVGWKSSSERERFLSSALVRPILNISVSFSTEEMDEILAEVINGISDIQDSDDLCRVTAAVLFTVFGIRECSVQAKISNKNRVNQIRKVKLSRTLCQTNIPLLRQTATALDWSTSHDTPVELSDRTHTPLSQEHNTSAAAVFTSYVLETDDKKVSIRLTWSSEEEAHRNISSIPKLRFLRPFLSALKLSSDRIANKAYVDLVEREAETLAEKRAIVSRELSQILGKEREKLYTDLLITNKNLEKTSRRLESALQITREMFMTNERFQASLKAAGHILRACAWHEPCFVEVWFHESFHQKTGGFRYCRVAGSEALAQLAESKAILNEFPTTSTKEAPTEFPLDSLKGDVLSECEFHQDVLCIPISRQGFGIGLLRLGGIDQTTVSQDDLDFIETLAHSLAIVIHNIEILSSEKAAFLEMLGMATQLSERLDAPVKRLVQLLFALKKDERNNKFAVLLSSEIQLIQKALGDSTQLVELAHHLESSADIAKRPKEPTPETEESSLSQLYKQLC